jgi:carboxypeptidase PM20D1
VFDAPRAAPPAVAERLSRMIRLPTISAEIDQRGLRPFREFEALLAELYPLVHERCERERITDLGLVYRLPGTRSDTDPAVLMAHYDVVPVGEDPHAEGWTHLRSMA